MAVTMTIKGAEAMARQRWGKNAAIQYYNSGARKGQKSVGVVVFGMLFEVKGQGTTWEECFADADSKKR